MNGNVTAVEYDFYIRNMPKLIKAYPNIFDKKFPKILSLDIREQIVENTDFTTEQADALMKIWTRRREYKAMGCSVTSRYSLDGFQRPLTQAHIMCFVGHFKSMPWGFPGKFAAGFKKLFKRPAFTHVPAPVRIDYAEKEEQALAEISAKKAKAKKSKRRNASSNVQVITKRSRSNGNGGSAGRSNDVLPSGRGL